MRIELHHPILELIEYHDTRSHRLFWVLRKKQVEEPTDDHPESILTADQLLGIQKIGFKRSGSFMARSHVDASQLTQHLKSVFPQAELELDYPPMTSKEEQILKRYDFMGINVRGEQIYRRHADRALFVRVRDKDDPSKAVYVQQKETHAAWRFLQIKKESDILPVMGAWLYRMKANANLSPAWDDIQTLLNISGFRESGLSLDDRQIQEYFESAMVRHGIMRNTYQQHERVFETIDEDTFRTMVSLYNRLPVLNNRSSTSLRLQQYSTPIPLAYLVGQMVGRLEEHATVLEPAVGHGALLSSMPDIAQRQDIRVLGIDLDERRLHRAQQVLPNLEAIKDNSLTSELLSTLKTDVVVTNPPFGGLRSVGMPSSIMVDGIRITRQDTYMALRAIKTLKPGGKAVLILGGDSPRAYHDGALSASSRHFLQGLSEHYHVHGVFEISGSLYRQQGAAYPIRWVALTAKSHPQEASVTQVGDKVTVLSSWMEVFYAARIMQESMEHGIPWVPSDEQVPLLKRSLVAYGTPALEITQENNVEPIEQVVRVQDEKQAEELLKTLMTTTQKNNERLISDQDENEYQRPYQSFSQIRTPTTMIPLALERSTAEALRKIEEETGLSVDDFVMQSLSIQTKEELGQAFMPEQIDGISLMLARLHDRGAIINGDMTGIGKGRFLAAALRWGLLHGKKVVFLTEKPGLFSDFWRDVLDTKALEGLDREWGLPTIINSGVSLYDPRSTDGMQLIKRSKPAEIKSLLSEKRWDDDCPVVMMTYSQIRGTGSGSDARKEYLAHFSHDTLVLMDEAHNAAGESQTGAFIREYLAACPYVVYSSATFAKRHDQLPVFFKAFPRSVAMEDIHAALDKIGSASLEIVAANLAADGAMFRREHNNSALVVRTNAKPDEKQAAYYEQAVTSMAQVLELVGMMTSEISKSVNKHNEELRANLSMLPKGSPEHGLSMRMQSVQFGGRLYTLVRQFYLALKVDAVADEVLRALAEGKKPIVMVESTMEEAMRAAMGHIEEDIEEDDGEEVIAENNPLPASVPRLSNQFLHVVKNMVRRIVLVKKRNKLGDSEVIDFSEVEPYATYLREIDELLENNFTPTVPLSFHDTLRQRIEKAGYSCDEISGRSNQLVLEGDDQGTFIPRVKKPTIDLCHQFNNGDLDVLILGISGNAGLSLHASEKFLNQQQRVLIVAQIPADVNKYYQGLGRAHRVGQVIAPEIVNVSTYMPGENRTISNANRKMGTLNRSTKANQEDYAINKDSVDVLNELGNKAAIQLALEQPNLFHRLGFSDNVISALESNNPFNHEKLLGIQFVSLFTARLDMLSPEMQRFMWNNLNTYFQNEVEQCILMGQNPLKTYRLDWVNPRVISQSVIIPGTKESHFDGDCVAEEIEHDIIIDYPSWEDRVREVEKRQQRLNMSLFPQNKWDQLHQMLRNSTQLLFPATYKDQFDTWYEIVMKPSVMRTPEEDAYLNSMGQGDEEKQAFKRLFNHCSTTHEQIKFVQRHIAPGMFLEITESSSIMDQDQNVSVTQTSRPVLITGVAAEPSIFWSQWSIYYQSPEDSHSKKTSLYNFLVRRKAKEWISPWAPQPKSPVTLDNLDPEFKERCVELHKNGLRDKKVQVVFSGNIFRAACNIGTGQLAQLSDSHGVIRQVFVQPSGYKMEHQKIVVHDPVMIDRIIRPASKFKNKSEETCNEQEMMLKNIINTQSDWLRDVFGTTKVLLSHPDILKDSRACSLTYLNNGFYEISIYKALKNVIKDAGLTQWMQEKDGFASKRISYYFDATFKEENLLHVIKRLTALDFVLVYNAKSMPWVQYCIEQYCNNKNMAVTQELTKDCDNEADQVDADQEEQSIKKSCLLM